MLHFEGIEKKKIGEKFGEIEKKVAQKDIPEFLMESFKSCYKA